MHWMQNLWRHGRMQDSTIRLKQTEQSVSTLFSSSWSTAWRTSQITFLRASNSFLSFFSGFFTLILASLIASFYFCFWRFLYWSEFMDCGFPYSSKKMTLYFAQSLSVLPNFLHSFKICASASSPYSSSRLLRSLFLWTSSTILEHSLSIFFS